MSTRRTYTREFKIEAVSLLDHSDKSIEAKAETLGVSRSSLNRGRSEFGVDSEQALLGNGQGKERDEEVAGLQKALREAQMENEILKLEQNIILFLDVLPSYSKLGNSLHTNIST